jgi:hypothetical protein
MTPHKYANFFSKAILEFNGVQKEIKVPDHVGLLYDVSEYFVTLGRNGDEDDSITDDVSGWLVDFFDKKGKKIFKNDNVSFFGFYVHTDESIIYCRYYDSN